MIQATVSTIAHWVGQYQSQVYERGVARCPDEEQAGGMAKRILAAFLWLFAGWIVGALVAFVLGISAFLGPVLGVVSAVVIAVDPRHIIWTVKAP